MAKLLVQIMSGPEHPTRATLGFLIAKTAAEEGHDVTIFVGGDAVQLLRDAVLDSLTGHGTGRLREWFDDATAAGAKLVASRMSSDARGVVDSDIEGKAEFVRPTDVVRLTVEHDRVLSF